MLDTAVVPTNYDWHVIDTIMVFYVLRVTQKGDFKVHAAFKDKFILDFI